MRPVELTWTLFLLLVAPLFGQQPNREPIHYDRRFPARLLGSNPMESASASPSGRFF